MAPPDTLIIGGICLPLDLEQMESLPLHPGGVVQFDFVHRGIRFGIRYGEEAGGTHVRLVGDVGPMPFSAEAPAARAGLGQIIMAANDALGPVFRLVDGRILLGTEFTVEAPLTAIRLISGVARALIPAIPYLDLIAVYLRPPMDGPNPGRGGLRPEWRRRKIGE